MQKNCHIPFASSIRSLFLQNLKYLVLSISSLGLICFASVKSVAQQDAEYTMYMFNRQALNPGYVGSRERFSITGLFRKQWTNIDGAPNTQSLAVQSPFLGNKMGLGALIVNDRLGDTHTFTLQGSYAYRLSLGKGKLALGLQAGFTQYRTDFSDLRHSVSPNVNDPVFAENLNEILPSLGLGVYYQAERFYAGFSVPQIIDNNLTNGVSDARQSVHYFATAAYVVNARGRIHFKPSFFLKYVSGAPLSLDLNTNVNIYEWFEVGLTYRWEDAINAIFLLPIGKNFVTGYAYDFTVSGLGDVNSGSHELVLRYEFRIGNKNERIITPRYF